MIEGSNLAFMIPEHIFWYSWKVVTSASQIDKTSCIDEKVWPTQDCYFGIWKTTMKYPNKVNLSFLKWTYQQQTVLLVVQLVEL